MNIETEATIGGRIRFARQRLGFSQKDFASEISIGPNYLSAIERGTRQPSVQLLELIASKTGFSYNWLCGDEILKNAKNSLSALTKDYYRPYYSSSKDAVKAACAKICYFSEPSYYLDFFDVLLSNRTAQKPNFWFHIHQSAIKFWCFDTCSSAAANPASRSGSKQEIYAHNYYKFLSRALCMKEEFREVTKYSFIVKSDDELQQFPDITVPVGNISIILLDPKTMCVTKERYLCRANSGPISDALDTLFLGDNTCEGNRSND